MSLVLEQKDQPVALRTGHSCCCYATGTPPDPAGPALPRLNFGLLLPAGEILFPSSYYIQLAYLLTISFPGVSLNVFIFIQSQIRTVPSTQLPINMDQFSFYSCKNRILVLICNKKPH